MALAANLHKGAKHRVKEGPFSGDVVTILDPRPFPDGDPQGRQRKVTVSAPDGNPAGMYILPRQLDSEPIAEAPVYTTPVVQPTPVVIPANPIVDPSLSPETAKEILSHPGATLIYKPNPITDPMDDRLDYLRPSKAKINTYVHRTMPNGMSDVEFALQFVSDRYRQEHQGWPAPITFKGDTSTGKTFFVDVLAYAWAEFLGYPKAMPIFTISGSAGVTDYDLFGQVTSYTTPDGREMLVYLPGQVDNAARIGGILLFDEHQAIEPRYTSSLHSILDHRHNYVNRNKPVWKDGQFMADVVVADQDLWPIGSYNDGYRGMVAQNEAFKNRMRHIPWDYDPEVEKKLIKSEVIRLLGQKMRTARQAKRSMSPCGTSLLQRLELDINTFGIQMGMDIFKASFEAHEQADVEAIIEDGSIYMMLVEEERQARINSRVESSW